MNRSLAVILVFFLCAPAGGCKKDREEEIRPLPFLWATATSGFQVDMGCPSSDCSDPSSDWWVWVHDRGNVAEGMTSGDVPENGPGHWELYAQDFDRAAEELGTNGYRFSMEWGRLFPTSTEGATTPEEVAALADQDAVHHYHAVLDALRERGMHPLVTLHHYTIPLWAHDPFQAVEDWSGDPYEPDPAYERSRRKGWLEPDFMTAEFAKYARYAASEFGGKVDLWITQNEPVTVVSSAFLLFGTAEIGGRTNPPGIFDFHSAVQAYLSMIQAHIAAYDAIKEADTADADRDGDPCMVGVTLHFVPLDPVDPESEADRIGAEHADYFYNRMYLNAAAGGDYDRDFDMVMDEHRDESVGRVDFVGMNYYFRTTITGVGGPLVTAYPIFDFIPEEVGGYSPEGFTEMIDLVVDSYGLPVIVTENGAGLLPSGVTEEEFIVRHLHHLLEARDAGRPVLGYCYWSLLDNLEWNVGFGVQMGLFGWDADTKARWPKDFLSLYRRIIEEDAVPADLWETYGP
jgi:beta-galactosidase